MQPNVSARRVRPLFVLSGHGIARTLALLLVACASMVAVAAPALADEPAPAQTWVTDGQVESVVPGTSGVVYITGAFSGVSPATGAFGSFDSTTGAVEAGWPDVVGTIYAIAPDGSGGWYIGGLLSSVGGRPRQNLAHIRADKSVDTAWAPSADGVVRTLAVDGLLVYAGGDFGEVDGQARGRLAAVDATTGALSAFDPEVSGTPAVTSISSIALVGTTLYAAGQFTMVGADARSDLAAIDTTTGLATSWAPDPDGSVATLAVSGSTCMSAAGSTRSPARPGERSPRSTPRPGRSRRGHRPRSRSSGLIRAPSARSRSRERPSILPEGSIR